jgi:hypothetical protein
MLEADAAKVIGKDERELYMDVDVSSVAETFAVSDKYVASENDAYYRKSASERFASKSQRKSGAASIKRNSRKQKNRKR